MIWLEVTYRSLVSIMDSLWSRHCKLLIGLVQVTTITLRSSSLTHHFTFDVLYSERSYISLVWGEAINFRQGFRGSPHWSSLHWPWLRFSNITELCYISFKDFLLPVMIDCKMCTLDCRLDILKCFEHNHVFTVDTLYFLLPNPVIKSDLSREELLTLRSRLTEAKLLRVKGQSVLICICSDWPRQILVPYIAIFRCLLLNFSRHLMLRVESKPVFTFCNWDGIVKHWGRLDIIGIFLAKILRLSRLYFLFWLVKGIFTSQYGLVGIYILFYTHSIEVIVWPTTCQNLIRSRLFLIQDSIQVWRG